MERRKIMKKGELGTGGPVRSTLLKEVRDSGLGGLAQPEEMGSGQAEPRRLGNMRRVLGLTADQDPIARLRELLVDQGLSCKAAADRLGNGANARTLAMWARREGLIVKSGSRPRTAYRIVKLADYCNLHRDLWRCLTSEQLQVVELLDNGIQIRTPGEIAVILGVDSKAVSSRLIRAQENLKRQNND